MLNVFALVFCVLKIKLPVLIVTVKFAVDNFRIHNTLPLIAVASGILRVNAVALLINTYEAPRTIVCVPPLLFMVWFANVRLPLIDTVPVNVFAPLKV